MNATITQQDLQQIAAWLADAQELLARVEDLERSIALTLGVGREGEDRDAITDMVAGVLPLAALLRQLDITVVGGNGAARP